MEGTENKTMEHNGEIVVEEKKGVLDWVKVQFDKIPTPVKYIGAAACGAAVTVGWMLLTGKSDSVVETPDVIDVACNVSDVVPDAMETVEDSIETAEF